MTSKEALKDIFMEALALDKEKRVVTISKLHEEKEQIERDLELLEILCNHLSAFLGTGEDDSGTQKVILLRGNILENDKDFEKLKARLEVQEEVNNNDK